MTLFIVKGSKESETQQYDNMPGSSAPLISQSQAWVHTFHCLFDKSKPRNLASVINFNEYLFFLIELQSCFAFFRDEDIASEPDP